MTFVELIYINAEIARKSYLSLRYFQLTPLPAYLPTYLPTYLPIHLSIHLIDLHAKDDDELVSFSFIANSIISDQLDLAGWLTGLSWLGH